MWKEVHLFSTLVLAEPDVKSANKGSTASEECGSNRKKQGDEGVFKADRQQMNWHEPRRRRGFYTVV